MHEQDLLCITDSVVSFAVFFFYRGIYIETLFYSLGSVFYRLAYYTV